MMVDLRALLAGLPPDWGQASRAGKEYVNGWGVFALPFATGHVLALRVFPHNDFGPYVSVWHRDPHGRWSIYVDGARLDTTCPRYFGPAAAFTSLTTITVFWTVREFLRFEIIPPAPDWAFTAHSTRLLS